MSADSGIGTFRGVGGAWSGLFGKLALLWGGTPLGWWLTPSLVWRKFVRDFYNPIAAANPHSGHDAIARLALHGDFTDVTVITMNVDGLHQEAGSPRVIEVHGSVRRFVCSSCGNAIDMSGSPPDPLSQPRCAIPKCNGRCRPDVTLFTESLPEAEWAAADAAVTLLRPGDVVFVVGTSSVVYPAAGLPSAAKEMGATLIEFNAAFPTPLSDICDHAIAGKAAESLPAFVDAVLMSRGMVGSGEVEEEEDVAGVK